MLRFQRVWLGAPQAPTVRELSRRLRKLKDANSEAREHIQERRRLAGFVSQHQRKNFQKEGCSTSHCKDEWTSTGSRLTSPLKLLPTNTDLEAAMAYTIIQHRDARAELEFTRQLLNSTLLSLASPVGPWDPYDVKPQLFALDTYLALPVFTSLPFLSQFCASFGFTVRDPVGYLWADGSNAHGDPPAAQPCGSRIAGEQGCGQRQPCAVQGNLGTPVTCVNGAASGSMEVSDVGQETHDAQQEDQGVTRTVTKQGSEASDAIWPSATILFDELNGVDVSPVGVPKSVEEDGAPRGKPPPRRNAKRRRRREARQRKARLTEAAGTAPGKASGGAREEETAAEKASKAALMQRLSSIAPFGIRRATPLPAFGPFTRPFFVGYFADIGTLLHNASIAPSKVDIVLNPSSPIELVLAREATDRILNRDRILLLAYRRLERELQREFYAFFTHCCPEIRQARTACVPKPLDSRLADNPPAGRGGFSNPLQETWKRTRDLREAVYANGAKYEIALLIQSDNLSETYTRLQQAKQKCLLMGHMDLDILPEEAAAEYVRDASTLFYDRASHRQKQGVENGATTASHRVDAVDRLGAFIKAGTSHTINVASTAESFYHDPTNTYTEAHAVFTEELKVKQRF